MHSEEFAECSFRVREDASKPSEAWKSEDPPDDYMLFGVLASLLYEVN